MKGSTSVPPTLRFGVFELDSRAGELRKKGMKIRLQGQPLEILALLLEHPGETVTREELQKKLWPADTFVDFEQGLNNAMKRLRAALDENAETPRFIETLPRRGYRFIGTVNGAGPASLGIQTKTGKRRRRTIQTAVFVGLAAIGISTGLVGFNVRGSRDRLFAYWRKPNISALAVLPLANLSADPEQEYLTEGMTEALITELGKLSSPRVISRQSVMQYMGSKKSLQEIARELNVDALLEGAVERSGNRVRVTVHLSQAFPERQMWSKEYDRSLGDVLSLQGEIALAVSDEIKAKLRPEEQTRLATSRTVDPEVEDNYLRGAYLAGKFTVENSQKAIAYLNKAIEKDPTYAPAYAELAMVYFWFGNPEQGGPSAKETMPKAKAAVRKALQLDPTLPRAHLALGLILLNSEWNWSEAENQYRISLKLNPNCSWCLAQYSVLLTGLGRYEEATTLINRANEVDPFNHFSRYWLAWIGFFSRRYDLAIKQYESLNCDCDMEIGLSYAQEGKYPEAIASLRKGVTKSVRGQALALGFLAQVYGLAGEKREAQRIIYQLKERSRHEYVFPSVFAIAYLGLGEKDQALTWFERAYEQQDPWPFYLRVWPSLDPIRSEPRFQALMRRINLAPS